MSFDKKIQELLLSKISSLFEKQLESKSISHENLFNFSIKENQKILDLVEESNGEILSALERETLLYNEAREELDKIETALVNAPKDDEIGPQISKLNELNKQLGILEAEISHLDQNISTENAL